MIAALMIGLVAVSPAGMPATDAPCVVQPRAHCIIQPASVEAAAAASTRARDLTGWGKSLYRGKWWRAEYAGVRRCIMQRESNFRYTAKNPTSSASGAYQFLDSKWRRGLVHMMLAESRQTRDGLASQIRGLMHVPIRKWSRYYQDRAFYTAYRHGKGAKHWAAQIPGTGCW
jgi:hypothetical protein